MSGKYLKEVHACDKPEINPAHNQGTVWQCDCGRIYVQSWHQSIYGIPSSWSWRPIKAEDWDPTKLEEKSTNYIIVNQKKRNWRLFP